ncbi:MULTISPECIES: argininosuccinate lyase [Kosmotoga]|uniref:Argininosuccinate lyase n=1 Tax=Kosmotoga olearia (strain ATCC BAA-1733 / DSM 21960 / TBF 19.5.1) TaxID=521045 RepID=C5CHW6_KOSOT|nr:MULTISPECIES: argininosuccinate lyase [Kosmotoga]ACR78821.1 argininosuccinate lyase [Kosmotoga olearia TBF 19.5.1]MDI3524593.1 argininosuccinate lyase [Kosmotoga sp.]OAA21975.1 argininosuccinate lyase [Kosmotoga sp. DU53]
MSIKLWEKGYEVDPIIEAFTIGNDYKTDMRLIKYDIKASMAHAEMLCKMGYLSRKELKEIKKALEELLALVNNGKFVIKPEDEDCHTAIENFLTQKIGEAGKKIHTARSRNDQVLTALRLFYKDELENIVQLIKLLQKAIEDFSTKYGHVQFAGFTHTRKAMPTDFKTWSEALYDSLEDDLKLLKTAYEIIDQSPLGTGAGYGIPIEIDREYTANELAFSRIQKNPIYSQNSRGKFDYLILHVLSQISYDLNRVSSDIIFFSLPEVGYMDLPKELCTGSSIMPQKLNPDPLELVRGYHNRIVSRMMESVITSSNLISGYHRDFQLLKESVIECFDVAKTLLKVMKIVFERLSVNKENCEKSITEEVLATQKVYEMVKKGTPFRDAYRKIAQSYGGEKK